MVEVNFTYAKTDSRDEFAGVIGNYSNDIERIFFNIQSDDACYINVGADALMSLQPLHDYKIGVVNHFVMKSNDRYAFDIIECAISYLNRIDDEIDAMILPNNCKKLLDEDVRFSKFQITPAGIELAAALRRLGAVDGWLLKWSI